MEWAGIATLIIAFVLWAALLRPVLAAWRSPTVGVSRLLAVSTESLAVLALTLAAPEHARWLLIAAGANALGILEGVALKDIAAGLWVLTMLWLLVLLGGEARWPRLRRDARAAASYRRPGIAQGADGRDQPLRPSRCGGFDQRPNGG